MLSAGNAQPFHELGISAHLLPNPEHPSKLHQPAVWAASPPGNPSAWHPQVHSRDLARCQQAPTSTPRDLQSGLLPHERELLLTQYKNACPSNAFARLLALPQALDAADACPRESRSTDLRAMFCDSSPSGHPPAAPAKRSRDPRLINAAHSPPRHGAAASPTAAEHAHEQADEPLLQSSSGHVDSLNGSSMDANDQGTWDLWPSPDSLDAVMAPDVLPTSPVTSMTINTPLKKSRTS